MECNCAFKKGLIKNDSWIRQHLEIEEVFRVAFRICGCECTAIRSGKPGKRRDNTIRTV